MLELEVIEDRTFGNDVFEQRAQRGHPPLSVAELVDLAALGFRRRNVEGLVEGAVRRPYPQRGIEDEQRLAHGVEHVLREILNVRYERLHGPALFRLGECGLEKRFVHGSPPGCFNRTRSQGAGSRLGNDYGCGVGGMDLTSLVTGLSALVFLRICESDAVLRSGSMAMGIRAETQVRSEGENLGSYLHCPVRSV